MKAPRCAEAPGFLKLLSLHHGAGPPVADAIGGLFFGYGASRHSMAVARASRPCKEIREGLVPSFTAGMMLALLFKDNSKDD
jgi:hypothetical protein